MGDTRATHNDGYRYRVPFASGKKIKVGQSCHGDFSHHRGGPFQYAVDFSVPVGTPLHAAREGVVAKVKIDSNIGGRDPSYKKHGNTIKVIHDDGTVGLYLHLQKNGAVV